MIHISIRFQDSETQMKLEPSSFGQIKADAVLIGSFLLVDL